MIPSDLLIKPPSSRSTFQNWRYKLQITRQMFEEIRQKADKSDEKVQLTQTERQVQINVCSVSIHHRGKSHQNKRNGASGPLIKALQYLYTGDEFGVCGNISRLKAGESYFLGCGFTLNAINYQKHLTFIMKLSENATICHWASLWLTSSIRNVEEYETTVIWSSGWQWISVKRGGAAAVSRQRRSCRRSCTRQLLSDASNRSEWACCSQAHVECSRKPGH